MVQRTNRKQQLDVSHLAKLVTSAGGIVTAVGLAPARLLRQSAVLEDALFEQGHLFLVLDPHSPDPAQQTFDALLRAYEMAVDRRIGLSDESLRLIEGVELRRPGAESYLPALASRAVKFETVGRLWTTLSQQIPAVLFVADPDALASDDRAVVDFLANNVFSDPIGRLSPEMSSWDVATGALLFAPQTPVWAPDGVSELDYESETENAVRSLLETDEVVRHFARAAGGDVDELARIVERLPDSTTPLRLMGAQRLAADVRTVLELAAVAASPVAPDLLGRAYETIFGSSFFGSALRELCSEGFLNRTMGAGTVLVHLDDRSLAEALRDSVDDEVLIAMHSAFADAAISGELDDPAFIADHLLASGREAEASSWALIAGRRALERDAVEDAVKRLRQVVEYAESTDVRCTALSELIDAYGAAGELELALSCCEDLDELLDGEDARVALKVRTANLLNQFGSRADAIEMYDDVLEHELPPALLFDAVIGKGEAFYAGAQYAKARKLAEEHLVELEERCKASNDRTLHASALRLRNLLGKIAIFEGRLDNAENIFERNADEASRWSWDDEVSRAHGNLGIVAMQRGDDEQSLERLVAALDTVGATGGLPRAYCLINLATVFQKSDRFDEALEHCLEGLRCAKRVSDKLAYRSAANNLASIYHDLGAFERAWSIFQHLESVGGEELDLFSKHLATLAQANLLLAQGRAEEAIADFERLTEDDVPAFVSNQARARLTEAHVELEQWDVVRRRLLEVERSEAWHAHWLSYEAAVDMVDEVYDDVIEKTGLALAALPKRAAVRARLLRVRALKELGRDKEARQVLEDGVRTVTAALSRVPQSFHEIYAMKPEHVALFERAREWRVELPGRIRHWLDTDTQPEAQDTDLAAFSAWRGRYSEIVGEDARLHQIFRMVDRVASSDATVLIHGESGTGKELVASAMHEQGDRSAEPFVKVNCAAFVENLLLSELFGHEKGAFTGAVAQKEGRFARADGGTIFLDEIGDISPGTQVALLRVLQEGTFERVGGSETQEIDVRVVCATNKNLEELVERGEFRLDLYYRLKGVVVEMPALRERRSDIPRLARHFASSFAAPGRRPHFAPDAIQFMAAYSWPGNVRELQNFVKSILLFAEDDYVTMEQIHEFREFFSSGTVDSSLPPIDLNDEVVEYDVELGSLEEDEGEYYADPEEALVEQLVAAGGSLSDLKKRLEIECIKRALIETEGNVTRAAEILQMKRPRLSQIINSTDVLVELKQQLVS